MSRFAPGRRGSAGRVERRQDVVVEEVGERSVPDVVEQAGHAQRLGDQALGRDGRRRRRSATSAARRLG